MVPRGGIGPVRARHRHEDFQCVYLVNTALCIVTLYHIAISQYRICRYEKERIADWYIGILLPQSTTTD